MTIFASYLVELTNKLYKFIIGVRFMARGNVFRTISYILFTLYSPPAEKPPSQSLVGSNTLIYSPSRHHPLYNY
jgi:hypothetical protein